MNWPEIESYLVALSSRRMRPELVRTLPFKRILVALNFLHEHAPTIVEKVAWLEELAAHGYSVLLDSGCFSLACKKAKELGIPPPAMFMLSPSNEAWGTEFDDHLAFYTQVVQATQHLLAGYVEVDIGSLADRAATRAEGHLAGIDPIPAFRLFKDPLDELPGLLQSHDRLCIAGTAFCPMKHRVHGWHTVWRMWQEYNPQCRLHVLGVTPCSSFNSFSFTSSDSSTYSANSRYGQPNGFYYAGSDAAVPWAKTPKLGEPGAAASVDMNVYCHNIMAQAKNGLAVEKAELRELLASTTA